MWIQVIAVALVLAFPQIAMWLPEALEDAPGLAAPRAPDEDKEARDRLESGDSMTEPPAPPATSSGSAEKSR